MHLQLPVTATSTNLETVTMETLASKTMSEAMLISGASKQISCAIFYIFDFLIYLHQQLKNTFQSPGRMMTLLIVRACPKPNSGKKNFFEKASPPRKSYFCVLFHVLPTVFAYLAPIIGKN